MCLNIEGALIIFLMAVSLFVQYYSVSLGDIAVPGKRTGGTGVPGLTGVQRSLCHHCLLVNCS